MGWTPDQPLIRMRDVHKTFGALTILNGISLDVMKGEVICIIGPSGAGKSTLLRCINALVPIDRGSILVAGQEVHDAKLDKLALRRKVGMVFQQYNLFPNKTAIENVMMAPVHVLKRDRDEVEAQARLLLRKVRLEEKAESYPGELSGGQQQRVALARALVNSAKVLLLDEPLGALDLKLRKKMQLELKRIQQEVGITFIYVTHDQEEAMTMSDRLAVMRHGKMEQLGDPEYVYESPATEFVAGFLGASNLLEGEIKEANNGVSTVLLTNGGTVTLPGSRIPDDAGPRVKVGVRPEKVEITRGSAPANGDNRIEGTVTMQTYIGVSYQYKVATQDGTILTVYVQNLGAEEAPRQGEAVTLTWKPEHTFAVTPQDDLSMEEDDE